MTRVAAGGVDELQIDLGIGTQDDWHSHIAVGRRQARGGRDGRDDLLAVVDTMNSNAGRTLRNPHQPLVDRIQGHGRSGVAATHCIVDGRGGDTDLAEAVVDVDVGSRGPSDDCNLAGQGVGTTEPVDLAWIRTAERREDQLVARTGVLRQVGRCEDDGLAGAAAHDRAMHGMDRGLVRDGGQ